VHGMEIVATDSKGDVLDVGNAGLLGHFRGLR
jgi:hypothetical protein